MKKKSSVFLILIFLSACASLPATATDPAFAPTQVRPSAVPTTELIVEVPTQFVCVAPEPTQDDVERALNFTGKLFERDGWERSYTVAADKVSVTWLHIDGYLVYLEALIFPCSYEEPDIDNYFSDETWGIILSNYTSYALEFECENNAIRLYEFTAVLDNRDYEIRYWVVNDTPTRVVSVMFVFPFGFEDVMDEYAYSMFPTLEFCE